MRTIGALLAFNALVHAAELHQAARVCDADRMQQLLSRHPSLNEADQNGMTSLHIAVDSRQTPCVRLLLKAGADRNARDRQGRTAFDAAENIADMHERATFVYMLRNFGHQSSSEPMAPKPWSLEYSVLHRQTNVTNMLLEMGVDPNAIGTNGTTPLADAALKGDLAAVQALLARGARPDAISRSGTQAIHDAALGDSPEVIRELVKKGAEVNACTRDEVQTPLHIAAAMGRIKAIEALVALGANIQMKDFQGRTALDAAEHVGLTDVATFLRRVAPAK